MDYGGDVSVEECWSSLGSDEGATLIDVRTRAEWTFVGVPHLEPSMKPLVGVEWQSFPAMQVDDRFAERLAGELDALGVTKESKLYFLCRSGVRSLAAARVMTAQGYSLSYNVAGGFEGDPDDQGHRGKRNGWKASGLPWKQS